MIVYRVADEFKADAGNYETEEAARQFVEWRYVLEKEAVWIVRVDLTDIEPAQLCKVLNGFRVPRRFKTVYSNPATGGQAWEAA